MELTAENINTSRVACFDIETPSITSEGIEAITTIWCISVVIIQNGEVIEKYNFTHKWAPYSDGSIMEAVTLLNSTPIIAAHNLCGFDFPVIENVTGTKLIADRLDSLILAKLMYSKDSLIGIDTTLGVGGRLIGSYSLKAFGVRMGGDDQKLEFTDFDGGLTAEMVEYCLMDTVVLANFIRHLVVQENFPISTVITLEHEAAAIIAEQTQFGFYIDIDKARELNTNLLQEKFELATELDTMFNPKFLRDGQMKTYKKLSTVKKYLPNTHYHKLIGTKE